MASLKVPVLILFAALISVRPAAASDRYFPMQVGNQWILETIGTQKQILNIEVLRSRVFNKLTYYYITGYASRDMWFRITNEGIIYSLDTATGRETLQANLALDFQPYLSSLSGCNQTARLGDVVIFPGVATPVPILYDQGGCRSFIFRSESYRWDLGLYQRTVADADGVQSTYRLLYAKVNGRVFTQDDGTLYILSDFNFGARGWLTGFSDYSIDSVGTDMVSETRPLPQEISESKNGLYLQSTNSSTDYFMFLKRRLTGIEGLKPNTSYELSYSIVFDSYAPRECDETIGAPGENVYLKAGASLVEPLPVLREDNRIEMNIDKGSQQDGGADAGVVSSIENGKPCVTPRTVPVSLTKLYTHPQPVTTDDRGVLWLIVGTDSGYQGQTELYYESVVARLKPLP